MLDSQKKSKNKEAVCKLDVIDDTRKVQCVVKVNI